MRGSICAKLGIVPIERLTVEEFSRIPLAPAAPYIRPPEPADFWINRESGYAALVTQSPSAKWSYTILSRSDEDGAFRASAVSTGHRSRANATAKLHKQMDDPRPSAPQ
jgi:hypothetical protein